MSSIPIGSEAPPDDWVPVERRWFGLDKRTILPGVIAIFLITLLAGVLPAIDEAIEYDRQIEAGDVVDLGSGVTFVPAVGWGFPKGILVSDNSVSGAEAVTNLDAELVNGAIEFTATTGPFNGTPEELLTQIDKLNETYKSIDNSKLTGDPGTITTSTGYTGVGQAFAGVNVEGVIAAFVIDGIGIEFVVSGPPGTVVDESQVIADMIDSLDKSDAEVQS